MYFHYLHLIEVALLFVQLNVSMGLDYYAILDVTRAANRIDVILAYRKLAIRAHPIRQETTCNEAVELPLPTMGGKLFWRLLNEAFDVLCECLWYNQFCRA
jgi:hypothetical protein